MSFEKSALPVRSESPLEGEVIKSNEEDPRVLRRFSELPKPVGDYWRKIPLQRRRIIISDEMILKMPMEKIIRDFVAMNPEYQTVEELLDSLEHPIEKKTQTPENPYRQEKDITPSPDKPGLIGNQDRRLPNK